MRISFVMTRIGTGNGIAVAHALRRVYGEHRDEGFD